MIVLPGSVSEYSSLMAFDCVTRLAIKPADSRFRSVLVSIRCEAVPLWHQPSWKPRSQRLEWTTVEQLRLLSFQEHRHLGEIPVSIRVEMFNIFNHPNFAPPLNHLAVFTQDSVDPIQRDALAGAGQFDSTVSASRQVQFDLKVIW
jgi:hypothetical protein